MTTVKAFLPLGVLATLCCGPSIFAQAKPTTTTGTTGSTATNTSPLPTTNRNTINNTNNTNNTNNNFPNIQRPIFLSGKVQTSDGMPLPPGVTIERVCGANTRPVAYTDNKGHFQFEWGRTNGMLPDASNSDTRGGFGNSGSSSSSGTLFNQTAMGNNGSQSETELMNCELRAVAPGYRSDSVNLAGRRSLDNPDVGIIFLRRMGNVEGTSISATSLNAPKDSRKAYDKGIELMHKGKSEDAAKSFEKAVDTYPRYADAWYQLGRMRAAAESPAGARDAYVKALESDSKLVGPSVELGLMSFREKKWKEAVDYLDRAVKLDPIDFPQAWFASAVAHFNLKELDAAERSIRESVKLDTKRLNPRGGYLLGLILAEKGDFEGATAQLREYLKTSPDATEVETVRKQLGQLEKLASARGEGTVRQPN